jgi:sporulation protein YunB
MRKKFISKKEFKISRIMLIIFVIIIFITYLLLRNFNKLVTPKLINVATSSINKLNESILLNYTLSDMYENIDLDEVIDIVKNSNDEIISVDFNLKEVYSSLAIITKYLHESLNSEEIREKYLEYYDEEISSKNDSIVLMMPMGIASNNIYVANLGPRIPVKISYIGYLSTNIRIKLENYGINMVLSSIYIDCSITNSYIIPSKKESITSDYSILVSSKIISGDVPEYYGGVIEKSSSILNTNSN